MDIPIEFLPRFWVSSPNGLQGGGSGFLLAERIIDVYSIDCKINGNNNFSVIPISLNEIEKMSYLEALCQLIYDSWAQYKNLIIIGKRYQIEKILIYFLMKYGQLTHENSKKIIRSKIKTEII